MESTFDRRPILTISMILLILLIIIIVIGEIVCRNIIDYDLDYYTSVKEPKPGTKLVKPYGVHHFNSFGYSDDEFDLKDPRPRIGYLGDSVAYGIGAGQGYRISDLLKKKLPAYQHFNLSFMEYGVQDIERVIAHTKPFELDRLIYIMNLNDILPYIEDKDDTQSALRLARGLAYKSIDVLRGKSYFYNYLRTAFKNFLFRMGFESHGFKAFGLFPEEHKDVIQATTLRIKRLNGTLKDHGIRLCVLISPYEMQISKSAEDKYRALGIKWAKSFINGGTQKNILRLLENDMEVLDAYYAFVDPEDVEVSRRQNQLGQYFVYNKGDKLDWNHPNREGHRKIAGYVMDTGFCGL